MPEPIYVLVMFIVNFLNVLSFGMLLRAVLGWFSSGEGKFMRFLYTLTEPVVYPFRKLFYKLNWFQDSPIDVAFTFSWIFLYIVEIVVRVMI